MTSEEVEINLKKIYRKQEYDKRDNLKKTSAKT